MSIFFIVVVSEMVEERSTNKLPTKGILFMKEPEEIDWVPHYFMLTETKLVYTEVPGRTRWFISLFSFIL